MGVSAKNKAYSYRQSVWLLSNSAVSRWMTCMCFSVWHSMTQKRENQPHKCYWTKKQQKKKKRKKTKERTDRNILYYSVVDTCCQKLHIAMVISKNKMCTVLSHTCGLLGLVWFLTMTQMTSPYKVHMATCKEKYVHFYPADTEILSVIWSILSFRYVFGFLTKKK